MKVLFLTISCILISYISFAQTSTNKPNGANRQMPTGTLYGKLIESKSNKPIEYASVELIQNKFDSVAKKRKDVVINGMLTDKHGDFSLLNVPIMGQLKLKITVIGYQPYEKPVSFDIKPGGDMSAMMGSLEKDLGNIKVDIADKTLDNVTVTSSRPGLQLGIDRKVFNVDKNMVSTGGTAVDVMRNVPSINVDIDGTVTMRNNSPQIFVDGRPTIMTLDQIPADAIESIEIITNPSAKFDASGGTSGILNVVLKKNKRVGYSGSLRTNIDSRARIGFGGDINIRQNKVNFFVSANYNQRKSISNGTTDRITYDVPNTSLLQTDESIQNGNFTFLRAGIDYFIDNRNTISFAGNIGRGRFKPTSESEIITNWLTPVDTSSLSNRFSNSSFRMNMNGGMMSFKHLFPKQGEEFTADVNLNIGESVNDNIITNNIYKVPGNTYLRQFKQQQIGKGENKNLVLQSDYTKPLSVDSKVEVGVRAQYRKVYNRNDFFYFNNGTPAYSPDLSVNYNSVDKVFGAYTTYSNKVKDFGYQVGLRVETSDYEGNLPEKNQQFKVKFPVSLFPSLFLNQKLKNEQELQLNYTRKINRPGFYQLMPFTDYADSLNISRGNPGLSPEFTNSVELTYQKTFKNKDNFIASIYYKYTTDLITRYQAKEMDVLSGKDILINTYINASSSYVTGLELVSKNKLTKWWDVTSNFNLFTSKITTGIVGQPEQDQFASWFTKLNNTFKLPKNFIFQLSGEYQSRTVLPPGGSGGGRGGGFGMMGGGGGGHFGQSSAAQGYVRANYFVDAALRYDFMKNKQASLSLNINDIFRTRRQDIYSESEYFVQNIFRRRDPQVLRLNFNWRFGKFDANLFKRKNNKNQENGSDMMNMGQ
ncbi:MAG: outer membrane beta-barrel family protein [Chitinophagaceae bacterium]